MKATIQRVKKAKVESPNKPCESIDKGLLIYIGLEEGDEISKIKKAIDKILKLRIFEDENGKMNLNVDQVNGQVMIISQFTLLATFSSGNRPSYHRALEPKISKALYIESVEYINSLGYKVASGEFGSHMNVSYINDGPVTLNMQF